MKLDDLCAHFGPGEFPAADAREHPERDAVLAAREAVTLDQDMCLTALDELKARRTMNVDHPIAWVGLARYQHELINQIARLVAGIDGGATEALLARCRRLGSPATRRFIDGLGRPGIEKTGVANTLTVNHKQLTLNCRDVDDGVALGIETPDGWVEQLRMSRVGREALVFCTRTATFDVHQIPGRLTSEERWAIAEALEESGTFRMEAC